MIKTLDEAIHLYKNKYLKLINYDNERAEEYKQLYEWLEDYKELKAAIFKSNNRFQMIKEAIESKEETNCQ